LKYLDYYTKHNEAHIVPDFTGATVQEILDQNFDEIFDFIIIDSVFDNSLYPNTVVLQNPLPGSKVKKGRNVYITIVAVTPEMAIMPDLKDLTLRQAITQLKARGLSVRFIRYIPDIAENAVLGHYLNDDTLEAGSIIKKYSEIDLVLGLGRNAPVRVPFLIGMTPDVAKKRIQLSSFNAGKEYYRDDPDPEHSRVYRQEPGWDEENEYYRGDYISLWFRSDLSYNFDSLVKVLNPDTLVVDTMQYSIPDSSFFEDIE
jgi:beta-lactam-binding protein with PASTA domain